MESTEKMEAILAAIPWRCFHCDFITTDRDEAEAHFGDSDDASEFVPICKWWANMDELQRKEAFQDLNSALNAERRRSESLSISNEGLEYQVNAQESAIRSYKPFKDCRSINDIFNIYDSMEGLYLAYKEREVDLVYAVNNAGFRIMLTDDGKTILTPDVCAVGVPQQPSGEAE